MSHKLNLAPPALAITSINRVIQDGKRLATTSSMNEGKLFVYLLRSESQPDRYYTGLTSDVDARLQAHNAGRSPHTVTGRPWRVIVTIELLRSSEPSR
jgi:hypothetical protein